MEDWQQRVVDEYAELGGRLERLRKFELGEQWRRISPQEQDRLKRQFTHMERYYAVLGERIAALDLPQPAAGLI